MFRIKNVLMHPMHICCIAVVFTSFLFDKIDFTFILSFCHLGFLIHVFNFLFLNDQSSFCFLN